MKNRIYPLLLLLAGICGLQTAMAQPTITLGSFPTVCALDTSASFTYSATSGSPSYYSILWGAAAQNQGFRNSPGIITTLSGGTGDPIGYVATDAAGNIYYTDPYNNKVKKMSTTGAITTVAGNGSTGFSGDGGAATNAKLYTPVGLFIDPTGNLYIADLNNNVIRKVNTSGIISTIAGTVGSYAYSGDGGAATAAEIGRPGAIALDASGNLYICDNQNGVIRKVNTSGIISTFAGNGTPGFSGDGGAASAAQLAGPQDIKFDAAGNLLIADAANNVVRKINTSGIISTIAGNHTAGFSGNGGAATAAKLYGPSGIAIDALGNIYISDQNNNEVRMVNSLGYISTYAGGGAGISYTYMGGTPNSGYTGDGGLAASATLTTPVAVACGRMGNVFIADGNNVIREVSNQQSLTSSPVDFYVPPGAIPATYTGDLTVYSATGATTYTVSVVVAPSSGIINGIADVCTGSTTTLTNASTGGTWSSSNTSVASVSGGIVSGVTSGTSLISYTVTSACGTRSATKLVNVTTTPGITLGANPIICAGDTLANITYSSTTGSPMYDIKWDDTAIANGFKNTPGTITTFAGDNSIGGTFYGDGGLATAAGFYNPGDIARDAAGNTYVADYSNGRIRKINSAGIISTVAGTGSLGYSPDGTMATDANIYLSGMTVDAAGNIYISENGNGLVRKINTDGVISTVAGQNGVFGYSGDGGAATDAQISYCGSMTVDAAGNLLIVDYGNNVVRKVNTAGIISTVAGNGGTGYTGDGGPATNAQFMQIVSVQTDASNNIYVSDFSAQVIRKINSSGIISTYAGTGTAGYSGNNGAATAAKLRGPYGIYMDNTEGKLYISEMNNNIIRAVNSSGVISLVAGGGAGLDSYGVPVAGYTGDGGDPIAATFSYPSFMTQDNSGNLYITDYNNVVRKISTISTLPTSPIEVSVLPYVAPGTYNGHMNLYNGNCMSTYPISVIVAPSAGSIHGNSNVCIGGTSTLVDFSTGGAWSSTNTSVATVSSGVVTGIAAGTTIISYTVTSACGTHSATDIVTVNSTPSISLDTIPTLCLGDTVASLAYSSVSGSQYRITWNDTAKSRGFTNTPGTISTIAGNYSAGAGYTGDGGNATNAQLNYPDDVAIDRDGNLYIADASNGVIRKVATSGIITTFAGDHARINTFYGDGGPAINAGLKNPSSLAFDQKGNLYFADADNYVIRKVSVSGIITTVAGSHDVGYRGAGGPATNGAITGSGIAIDAIGNIYIADPNNHIVAKVDTNGIMTTVAGDPAIGYTYSGDGGPATAAGLSGPTFVAVDASGNVYISESYNAVIRKVNTSGIISTIAGNGPYHGSYTADGMPATSGSLYSPAGVKIDNSGNIVYADWANQLIRKINSDGTVSTIAGNYDLYGTMGGYLGDNGPADMAEMFAPYGIALDNNGNIYFADQYNHVVRKITTSLSLPSSPVSIAVPDTAGTGTYHGDFSIVNNGCYTSYPITVVIGNGSGNITGSATLCIGTTDTLTDTITGGTWTTSNSSIATVTGGIVTGVSSGTAIISYTVGAVCGTRTSTFMVSVTPSSISAGTITGLDSVCEANTITLTDTATGGTPSWTSSNTSVATVSSGDVTGILAGTATITYTLTGGCGSAIATKNIIVNPQPVAGSISGATSVCTGSSITLALTGGGSGGTWTSSSANATVSGGVVTGITTGTAIISYTVTNPCGAISATYVISINSTPSAGTISGNPTICIGAITTLTDGISGGAWSATNANATVTGGVVTGVTPGIDTIKYTVTNGCGSSVANYTITINPLPNAGTITGASSISFGSSITLTDATSGGVWSSSNTSVATVGTTGIVHGVAAGTAIISYSVTNSCGTASATKTVTVNSLAAITGSFAVCAGSTVTLSDATSGGSWTSSNTSVATIASGTGVVTGISAGTTIISYTLSGSSVTAVVTVNASLTVPGIITTIIGSTTSGYSGDGGPASAARFNTISGIAYDASGNTYISDRNNSVIRKINSSGIISTIGGTGTSGYSGDGGAATSANIYNPEGIAVDGSGNVYFADSYNSRIRKISSSGIISTVAGNGSSGYGGDGIAATSCALATPFDVRVDASGNLYIADYANSRIRKVNPSGILTTIAGNGTFGPTGDGGPATAATFGFPRHITFDPAGNLYIVDQHSDMVRKINTSGIISTVAGTTSGSLSDGIPATNAQLSYAYGVTTDPSGNIVVCEFIPGSVRSVNSSGIISTIAGGGSLGDGNPATAASVSPYNVFTDPSGNIIILDGNRVRKISTASAIISGTATVCTGSTSTYTTAATGGTWSSSSANATIGSTGIVTGVSAGTAIISYSIPCGTITKTISIIGAPASITGSTTVCQSATTTLSDATPGGTWSSSNTSVATIASATGVVTGVGAGTTTISYTTPCGTSATYVISVNPPPSAGTISGTPTVCVGGTTTLTDGVSGGVWSANNANASVSGGVVTGVTTGIDTIKYTVTNGCGSTVANYTVTINPLPSAGSITGSSSVSIGSSITLTDATSGGVWTSSNTSVATVGTTGIVSGVTGGTATISYTVTNSCGTASAIKTITVNSMAPITGILSVCLGSSTTLSDASAGGTWSSTNTAVATVGSNTGVVNGMAAGTAIISYSIGSGMSVTAVVTVNPTPASITGSSSVCSGSTITLSDITNGGTWSSSNTAVATVGTSGIVTGIGAGTVTISYSLAGGCAKTTTINVSSAFVATAGIITTIADAAHTAGYSGDGGAATAALLNGAGGIAYDNAGNAYIGDANNHVVRKINASGVITTISGNGTAGFAGDGGAASAAQLNQPTGIFLDASGNIYIADAGNSRIRKINTSGIISTIAGSSSAGFSGDGGQATAAQLHFPTDLKIDGIGNILIADASNNRIRKINSAGIISTVGGNGSTTFSGDGGAATAAGFAFPAHIGVDASGNIYLPDYTNNRVRKINTSGIISTIAGTGTGSYNGDGIAATAAQLNLPNAAYVDAVGNILIADFANNRVRSINPSGIISTVAGTGVYGMSGDGGQATAANINSLSTITTDPSGNLLLLCNQSIRKVSIANNIIVGSATVCNGSTSAYTIGAGGGTWSTSNTNASVNSTSGVVTGTGVGTSILSYNIPCGVATKVISILSAPLAITGTTSVCPGATTGLGNLTSGGVWTSNNTSVATVGASTGTVTGVTGGTTIISYTTGAACAAFTTVTVSSLSAITGPTSVCVGQPITLTDATPGGTWSSGNPSIASVGVATGLVNGFAGGLSVPITYTIGSSCRVSYTVSVYSLGTTTGVSTLCTGQTTTFTNSIAGGSWISSAPPVATVGSTTGVVAGITVGTAIITYRMPSGCQTTSVISIGAISAISGPTSVCQGQNITLTDLASGGVWTSGNTSIATVGTSSGIVTGMAGNLTVPISYTLGSGCRAITTVTVYTLGTNSGATSVCTGQTTTLSNSFAGGAWISSAPSVATIGSATGIVTGITSGTAIMTYMMPSGCYATSLITSSALSVIGGPTTVCQGQNITLTNTASGGVWTSGNISIATIGSSTGILTGVAGGLGVSISYTLGSGCRAITTVTVNTLGTNTGSSSICQGQTTTFTNSFAGGTWVSSAPSVASIGSSTGLVTGLTAGTTILSYVMPGGCASTTVFTVSTLTSISGPSSLCLSQTITLTDATPGGVWTSGNTGIATIGSGTGIVSGVTGGSSVIISYTLSSGCRATATVTINALGTNSGATSICTGLTTTLTNSVAGGSWISSATGIATIGSVSGIVTGVSGGTAIMTYMMPSGCYATSPITVGGASSLSGLTSVCVGQVITLTASVTGGVWSSSNPSIASVGSASGIVTGNAGGLTVGITYSLGSGCNSITTVTVNALAAITGATSVCTGQTTTLSNSTSGGVWSSSTTGVATIGSTTGLVSGISSGTATISYLLPSGCLATAVVSVGALGAISGPTSVCVGQTITLTDAAPGGLWTSGSPSIATVGSASGIVTGLAGGLSVNITYTLGSSCSVAYTLTVNSLSASSIPSTVPLCEGTTTVASNSTAGGVWSSGNTSVATIGSTGTITGVSAGTTIISYALGSGCTALLTVTVSPLAPITGPASVCQYQTITLSDATSGGTWSVGGSSASIASIGASTGIVTGLAANLAATLTYSLGTGCKTMMTVSVLPIPTVATITGPSSVSVSGSTITLSNATSGGGWSSSNIARATVGAGTGVVAGVSVGTVIITYSVTNTSGCTSIDTKVITVGPSPFAPNTSFKTVTLLTGAKLFADNKYEGGVWTSDDNGIAQVDAETGNITGIAPGRAIISYTLSGDNGTISNITTVIVKSQTEAINQITLTGKVILVPNPNKGDFIVKGNLNSADDAEAMLEVTDMLGQTVYKANINATNGKINEHVLLSNNLANGMYMLRIHSGAEIYVFHFVLEQ